MSGPARLDRVDLSLDPGVLEPGPVLEFGGWAAVQRHGGLAILPWRSWAAEAAAAGIATAPEAPDEGTFSQAVVHLGKGRAALAEDLHHAWRCLIPGGRLILVGGNDLGIASAAKRLGEAVGQTPEVLANRARGRAVLVRRQGPAPVRPEPGRSDLPGTSFTLSVPPGVFSGDGLDAGTAALLQHLDALAPPEVILDPGCGAGHLALTALLRWPAARAWCGDADHRAVLATRANAATVGVADRCQVDWWDAREAIPVAGADLVLVNPPAHAGTAVDTAIAGHMFAGIHRACAPGARMLVVANRHLPYEADLHRRGQVATLAEAGGFKVLSIALFPFAG